MVTDEKRREAARRLRELDVDSVGHGYELLEEVADCIGCEGVKYGASYGQFVVLLADLIEPGAERTCSMDVTDADHGLYTVLECSECGRSCEEVNGCYRYCPHCGARVVDDDD